MENKIALLKNYTRSEHEDGLYKVPQDAYKLAPNIEPLFSPLWEDNTWLANNKIPYVAVTYLLDSYYCMPQRPDMAFTYLWKAINNAYNTQALIQSCTNPNVEHGGDSNNLEISVKELSSHLNDSAFFEKQCYTIKSVIELYVKRIPMKTYRFVANYLLKGYVIKQSGFDSKYNTSSYFSFAKKYKALHQAIALTYGEAYKLICNPCLSADSLEVNFGICDKRKSKSIPDSLAGKLKELVNNRNAVLWDGGNRHSYPITLASDLDYMNFLFMRILYAIRNNTIHGNVASRLSSDYANAESVYTSNFIYLFGHLFLSGLLYLNKQITIDDFIRISIKNYQIIINIEPTTTNA